MIDPDLKEAINEIYKATRGMVEEVKVQAKVDSEGQWIDMPWWLRIDIGHVVKVYRMKLDMDIASESETSIDSSNGKS